MLVLAVSLVLSAAPAQLTIEVKPEGSIVKVDGKKAGTGAKPFTVKLKAGKHTIRVEYKGDATTEEIVVKAGEKRTWKWEFTGVEGEAKPQPEKAQDDAAPEGDSAETP
jgi:glutamate synthase domain-containing protein 2